MRILVTGGAGYIGSVMSEVLLEAGHRVVVLDNLSHGYRDAVHPEAEFVLGDVADRSVVETVLGRHAIDGVIVMSAFIEVGESVLEPHKYIDNNSLRPVVLLEAMRRAKLRKLVLSSTAAVYAQTPEPPEGRLSETAPVGYSSPYGLSKLFLEQTLAWYASLGLHYCALRYFNAAGATARYGERHRPESHLIPLVLQAAAGERAAISIYGGDYDTPDGTCVRDYIHVEDLCRAHLVALEQLEREAAAGPARAPLSLAERAYNLGIGNGFSVREVVAAAERVCGHAIPVIEAPRRGGDVARLVAASDRMRGLGWQPRYTELEAIIATAWHWKTARATTMKA